MMRRPLFLVCLLALLMKASPVVSQESSNSFPQVQAVLDQPALPPTQPQLPVLVQQRTDNLLAVGPGEQVFITPEEEDLLRAMSAAEVKALSAPYVRPNIRSMMFTEKQYAFLLEAQKGFNVNAEALSAAGIKDESPQELDAPEVTEQTKVDREISLGGILFTTPDEWTIYLNEQRVSRPDLPSEVVDIKVSKDFIDLIWMDKKKNKLYPIRLRINQRFNLDTEMFLPGKSG